MNSSRTATARTPNQSDISRHQRISVHESLKDAFIPSTLISVEPENAGETNETYSVELNENDILITKKSLEIALQNADENFLDGLIVRTLPNDESKLTREYLEKIPPFFSTEAMQFIREKNVKHLLCDLPSIDRIFDEGKLANHRTFWNIEQGSFETNENSLVSNTITELIYVTENINDGKYLLNLQIAPFASDASPSRPLLVSDQFLNLPTVEIHIRQTAPTFRARVANRVQIKTHLTDNLIKL